MKKKILIIKNKDDISKKNIIFYDEYLYYLYPKNKKMKKKNFFFSLKNLSKTKYNTIKLHNKIDTYRKELSPKLNFIHKKKLKEKDWGLILDNFLFQIINPIIIETNNFKKILKKEKNILISEESLNNFYLSMIEFSNSYHSDNRYAYIRYLIAKNLGFEVIKRVKRKNKILKKNLLLKESFYLPIFRNIVRFYIKIFKPNLFLNSYLGLKNTLILFFKNFGQFINIPSNYIFDYNVPYTKKDLKIRKLIKVKERDFIDRIFNIIAGDVIPASYIENFKLYFSESKKLSNLPSLGSGGSIMYDDMFKFLSVKLLNQKKKVISLQHGFMGKEIKGRLIYDQIYQKKYSSKFLGWYDKEVTKETIFDRYKKYKIKNFEQKNILIYPSMFQDRPNYKNNLRAKYHPNLNSNYIFYDSLKQNIKRKVRIKPYPNNEAIISAFWFKRYRNKDLFVKSKKNLFNIYKIIIINDVSTALCELMYIGAPFILLDTGVDHLQTKTRKKILNLKKINILFNNPIEAGKFVNNNFDNLEDWWKAASNSKIYLSLKKELLPSSKNRIGLIDKINS